MNKRSVSILKVLVLVLGITLVLASLVSGRSFFIMKDISKNTTDKLKGNIVVSDTSNFRNDIEDLIRKNIEKDYKKDSLDIREVNTNDDSTFVLFLVKDVNTLYEGLAIIEKEDKFYKLNDVDVAKVDINSPFTKHTLGVLLKDGRNCELIGGYINNEEIKEIHIDYMNNTTVVIKIGKSENTYIDYIIGNTGSIKGIIGLNGKDAEIYSYK